MNSDNREEQTTAAAEDRNYPAHKEVVFEFTLQPKADPLRVDVFLTNMIAKATRNKVQEAIAEGLVTVNGKVVKANRKVQPGDVVHCKVLRRPPIELVPENIPLDIVFEDDHVLVVHKPAGMVVHPAHGNRYGTLVNAVLYHLGERSTVLIADEQELEEGEATEGELFDSNEIRPGIVHRIDKDTSGILVIGKTPAATEHLSRQFFERTSKRVYHALVWGIVKEDEGTIDKPIGRSSKDRKLFAVSEKHGKHAVTDYKVLARFNYCTLLELSLRTGRTHQIRVHCAHLHHPLLSDAAYGGNSLVYGGIRSHHKTLAQKTLDTIPRQALHATSLGFTHPHTGEWMQFTSSYPVDFQAALDLVTEIHSRDIE